MSLPEQIPGLKRALAMLRHPNAGMEPPDGGDPSQTDRVRNVANEIEELLAQEAPQMSLPDNKPTMSRWRIKRSGGGMAIIGTLSIGPMTYTNKKLTGVSEVFISANDGKIYAMFAETSPYFVQGRMELFTDGW